MARKGYGNRRLAEELGVSHPPVGDWLRGKASPRPETLSKISVLFGVPVAVLLDDKQQLPSDNVGAPKPTGGHPPTLLPPPDDDLGDYLAFLKSLRERAERLGGDDPAKVMQIFDKLLATWTAAEAKPAKGETAEERKQRLIDAIKKTLEAMRPDQHSAEEKRKRAG